MGHTLQAASLLPSSMRGAGGCAPRAQEGLPFFLHWASAALLQSRPARAARAVELRRGDEGGISGVSLNVSPWPDWVSCPARQHFFPGAVLAQWTCPSCQSHCQCHDAGAQRCPWQAHWGVGCCFIQPLLLPPLSNQTLHCPLKLSPLMELTVYMATWCNDAFRIFWRCGFNQGTALAYTHQLSNSWQECSAVQMEEFPCNNGNNLKSAKNVAFSATQRGNEMLHSLKNWCI